MQSLHEYLFSAKSNINTSQLVVIGNEAADLDSMASSIAYGYLRQLISPELTVLPVMPIPRADFVLRTEAVYVFNEAGINMDDVVFMDEVNLDAVLENAAIVLVDHNKIAVNFEMYSDKISGIVDHHKDEGLYPDATPRIITTIGSTASLVAQEFAKASITISENLAILLGGTILLDTVNLAEKAGRVTDADREVTAVILPLCPLSQQEFFDKVQEAKFNVDGLSTNDLLRKDYKEWQLGDSRVGIGSALLPVTDWIEMDTELATGFEAFCTDRKLDLLLSMNAFSNPDFGRDLVLFTKSKDASDKLYGYLQDKGMELSAIENTEQKQSVNGYIAFYRQGNLDISRKKLQPFLSDFLCN